MSVMTSNEPSRLDRLEALAETILIAIQQNSQQIEHNSQQIERNSQQIERNSHDIRESINDVVEMIANLSQQTEERNARIEENSAYIRGLQAENRRILDYLLNRNQQNDGD